MLAIGVPTMVRRGYDINAFNAHRIYGPIMYPFLTTNWRFIWPIRGNPNQYQLIPLPYFQDEDRVDTFLERDPSGFQPVFVFEKIDPGFWGFF